jgi:predicted deacylase
MAHESVTHTRKERRLGRLPSGATVTVTVHRYVGGPGPTVYVQAAQHGIELNGPAVLRRLHDRLIDAEIAGTVVAVPVANPTAFDHRSYMTPAALDALNPNMNRVWPGDDEGSLQERLVARLWELFVETDPDAAVDLHTGTADMLEHVRFDADGAAAADLAAAFGADYLLAEAPVGDGGAVQDADGTEGVDDVEVNGDWNVDVDAEVDDGGGDAAGETFRTAAARAGVPTLTAELSNSRRVTRRAVHAGVDGLVGVFQSLGVTEGDPTDTADPTLLYDDAPPTVATVSGLFEPRSDLGVGDRVADGDRLGVVYCPSSFERLQTVTAAAPGVVYSLAREAVAIAGERLVGVATPA